MAMFMHSYRVKRCECFNIVHKDTKNTKISVHKLIFIPNIWTLAKVYVPLRQNDRNYGC